MPPPKIARVHHRLPLFALVLLGLVALPLWFIFLQNKAPINYPASLENMSASAVRPDESNVYAAYGRSASCEKCHEEAFADWKSSNHGLAERQLMAAKDDAAFIPTRSFTLGTQTTTVRTNAGHYQLITAGLQTNSEVFTVERVLANMPLRQMLIPFPGGRLQATEVAWDPRSNQWFDVYGNEDRKPGEWGHWTGRGMNWNSMCAVCHNTRLHKRYDIATDSYHTTMVENAVGCEACHGPLKDHNVWQLGHEGQSLPDPTIHKLTRDQMVDTCAACHSRRAELTADFKPGDRYWDHFQLSIVDESDLFYPDGQIHDEDYEFTAFLGSRMYNHGVRCMDCHNPHTMKTRLPGNLLCMTCHAPGATNAPAIDPVSHSHHLVFGYDAMGTLTNLNISSYKTSEIKQTGGECVNCHMPQTVYMERHWRHDHGFTLPDPLLTKQFGIPNACNRCHADKSTDWSLDYVEKWYGTNMNRPYRQRAQILARARQGDNAILAPLLTMLQTDEFPYWRAVAANLLQPWAAQAEVREALIGGLGNTNPLVRQTIVQSLGPLVDAGYPDAIAAVKPRLQDPSRNVRIEAARLLAATLDTNSPAGTDYLEFLDHIADQPLGQMQIGVFEFKRGDATNALAHFRKAAEWDPYSAGIRHELAIILSRSGRTQEAINELEEAVKLAPNEAEFHYKLALALNETGQTGRVIAELEAAVELNPRHARAWYNLGLARSAQGDDSGADAALIRAESADPNDPRIPYARATVLARQGRLAEARAAARRALELDHDFAAAAGLLRQLDGQ